MKNFFTILLLVAALSLSAIAASPSLPKKTLFAPHSPFLPGFPFPKKSPPSFLPGFPYPKKSPTVGGSPSGGITGPVGGFGIPPVTIGGGGGAYGAGSGTPNGGHTKQGSFSNPFTCKLGGKCFNRQLTCPQKCFTAYSQAGKNYGGGGGGGGCTFDCDRTCVASCAT